MFWTTVCPTSRHCAPSVPSHGKKRSCAPFVKTPGSFVCLGPLLLTVSSHVHSKEPKKGVIWCGVALARYAHMEVQVGGARAHVVWRLCCVAWNGPGQERPVVRPCRNVSVHRVS